jgi:hypothetical protein
MVGNVFKHNSELPVWFDGGSRNVRFSRNVMVSGL